MSERILGFVISPSQVSRRVATLGVAALAASLAACGGGGGNGSTCSTIDPNRDPNLPGCPTTTTPDASGCCEYCGSAIGG